MTEHTNPPHVIIIGAGFAGLSVVDNLRKAGVRVTVIDKNLYSAFQPLLYQVATGGLNPGDVAYPVGGFAARRGARYIRGELSAVDTDARRVTLDDGRTLDYDYLVVATGVAANYFGLPGAAEYTFGLYNRGDAIVLRDHIMNGFERLSASDTGDQEFSVTVVGGGATGVELAGTLGELRSEVLKVTFPDVNPERVHVRLIEMAPALLMPFDDKLREYARKQLENRGVDVLLNTKIESVKAGRVILEGDKELRSDLTVWAAGVAAPSYVKDWGLPQGRGGRIEVGSDLRVKGNDRVFAAGDIAVNPEAPLPQLAQPALQEGKHIAEQIKALLTGGETASFSYYDKGTMATIGRRSAVVQLPKGPKFTGTFAWLSWLALHLFYLLGLRNRVSTMINLSWRYLAWGQGSGAIVGDEPSRPLPTESEPSAVGAAKPEAAPAASAGSVKEHDEETVSDKA
ncbi:MAG: NAD(P)/FAD-dependent oxidoreductase [Streptosporangiales bacterium]|nr:NAD(P)/FAD-dependent oxidoreductase [Streptosporangiales bacterium]